MRIVTWNCGRGSHAKKLPPLLDLQPDLALIQESPRPEAKLADDQLWHGDNIHQGLLVLSFGGWRLQRAAKPGADTDFFLPVRVARGKRSFNLLAAWVKKPYLNTIRRALDVYDSFLSTSSTVLAGDLNIWCHEQVCGRFGLVSAYHEYFGVEFEKEKHPTHYHKGKRSPGYHFDYCFIPSIWRRRIRNVEVGGYRQWKKYSDHSPLVVDIGNR